MTPTTATDAAPTARRGAGQAVRAAAELSEWVTEGRLPPGTRLSEERLVTELGISRNTLREAFRVLAHDGLLVHRFNRGTFVAELTGADVRDVYRIRRLLEPTVVRALVPADADRLGALRAAVEEADEAVAELRWSDVGTANMHFHRGLVALAGSPRLDATMRRLAAELRLVFAVIDDPRRLYEPFVERNRHLYEMLVDGQYAEAGDYLEAYLADSEDAILRAFEEGSRR
ncbi:GntR family transcriptional regulator [Ornithinicoccus hortensis]|uniref:DNA-binding GntR family transcriptional regulator n=1 Tax=Ornithinicoccus hortensis TaxID=82346 RepID=A0A542YT03_9MICO|nr:GntR family transcriptional regulator [Ornithinicoccus hortensis]TQL51187.1 DNA-binding GntR family transcriptional regulator [Ornithinicoccus hortensis]